MLSLSKPLRYGSSFTILISIVPTALLFGCGARSEVLEHRQGEPAGATLVNTAPSPDGSLSQDAAGGGSPSSHSGLGPDGNSQDPNPNSQDPNPSTAGSAPLGPCPQSALGPALVSAPWIDGKTLCIDATEVTNAHYATFLAAHPSPNLQPSSCSWNSTFVPGFGWPVAPGHELEPVVNVNWCDAYAFCAFAHKHLCGKPTGGQSSYKAIDDIEDSAWFSACSASGSKVYPYGNNDFSSYQPKACNGIDLNAEQSLQSAHLSGCEGGYPGLFNMSGNVWEWEDACEGDGNEDRCRVRGGSFRSDAINLTCASASEAPRSYIYDDFGFRCCADPIQ